MPRPKAVLNAFTSREVAVISGLSLHMVNYLALNGYLLPCYERAEVRGSVRYYSYRDLVIARLIQRLRDGGVELKRLKEGIAALATSELWAKVGKDRSVSLLVTDGRSLLVPDEGGSLLDLTRSGQLAFAFVVDVAAARAEVVSLLPRRSVEHFSLSIEPLLYPELPSADTSAPKGASAGEAPRRRAS